MPIPPDALIEGYPNPGSGDRHVLVLDRDGCWLFELFNERLKNGTWSADSSAIWDMTIDARRPYTWTSADAAGTSVFEGLARWDEVAAGEIRHALRFTVQRTQRAYVHPATHFASSRTDPDLPPMGLRVRLKANYDLGPFHGASRVILEGLKRYGMFVADNGGDWFISGETNTAWDDDDLDQLKSVPASSFEVVQAGPIIR